MKGWLSKRLSEVCAVRGMSPRTHQCYTTWVKAMWEHCDKRSPRTWTAADVKGFLTWMATCHPTYSAVAQKQAKNAVVFAARHVLEIELGDFSGFIMAPEYKRPPVVLCRDETLALLQQVDRKYRLPAELLYRCGLRLNECLQLRVQDLDLGNRRVIIHDGKGAKHREVPLPDCLIERVTNRIAWRRAMHDADLADGAGIVHLPNRLSKKLPSACRELGWQYIFPSTMIRDGHRWWMGDTRLQEAVKKAAKAAGIIKRTTPHTLRHCYATHLLMAGANIRDVQQLMGHAHIETTMIYLHVIGGSTRHFVNNLSG